MGVDNDAEPNDGKPDDTIRNLTGTRFERILAPNKHRHRVRLPGRKMGRDRRGASGRLWGMVIRSAAELVEFVTSGRTVKYGRFWGISRSGTTASAVDV
jgi:hypothetical protein